jgi:hypothetical protein
LEESFVSGHDFSRAEKRPIKLGALAPAVFVFNYLHWYQYRILIKSQQSNCKGMGVSYD